MSESPAHNGRRLDWVPLGPEEPEPEEISCRHDFGIDLESLAHPAHGQAVYQSLKKVDIVCCLDPDQVEIYDAGPGCAAVGAAKFFIEKGVESPKITLLEPEDEWELGHVALENFGLRFEVRHPPDLTRMLDDVDESAASADVTVVLCITHALRDVGVEPSALMDWWSKLANVSRGRQLIVLVLEREPCASVLPRREDERFEAGGWVFEMAERLPIGAESGSYCAALCLPKDFFRLRSDEGTLEAQRAAPMSSNANALPQRSHGGPAITSAGGSSILQEGDDHIGTSGLADGVEVPRAAQRNSMSGPTVESAATSLTSQELGDDLTGSHLPGGMLSSGASQRNTTSESVASVSVTTPQRGHAGPTSASFATSPISQGVGDDSTGSHLPGGIGTSGAAQRSTTSEPAASVASAMEQRWATPLCPHCKQTMVMRTNENGYNPGAQFWGCLRYPLCKGIRPAPPPCPDCHQPMKTRTNRYGYNPGSRFWGCSQYPLCKGTRGMRQR